MSLFSTRKIILNILPELKHNEFIYKPVCISIQTGYIFLAKEFTKPQIITEHFKRGNSDYIPRFREQYEINLKPRYMRDELSHRVLLVLY